MENTKLQAPNIYLLYQIILKSQQVFWRVAAKVNILLFLTSSFSPLCTIMGYAVQGTETHAYNIRINTFINSPLY
jgi:hypothetical protein